MSANAITSKSIKHRRYRVYMERRLICIVSLAISTLSLAILICVDIGIFPKLTVIIENTISELRAQEKYIEVSLIEKYVRTFAVYGVIAGALLAFRTLLEKMKESFFTAIIGAIATFLVSIQLFQSTFQFFENAFPMYWQRYLLILSYAAFGVFWFYYWGYYPLSTKILIDAMSRSLGYNERIASDWVKEGITDYSLEVFPLERVIPQDVAHLSVQMNGVKRELLKSALDKYYNKKPIAAKAQEVLILIGGFGAGKSTALAKSVLKQLKSYKHYGEIPVYVKLRVWLRDDIFDKEQPHNIYKSNRDEIDYYINQLSTTIVGNMDSDNKDNIKKILISLHESRRIVYVFDGLNELLQRSLDDQNQISEQSAKDLCTFLYQFCAGNRCIISMCEIPSILTTRSVLLNQTACYYLIYAVDGVSAKDIGKKRIGDWSWNYYHSVALFRLAQNEISKGNASPKTMYELLENYVQRQIENEIISSEEVKHCKKELIILFEERVNLIRNKGLLNKHDSIDSYYTSPYSYIYEKESIVNGKAEDATSVIEEHNRERARERYLSALVNCRILYRTETTTEEKQNDNPVKIIYNYHFCHILVYEYVMVEYILNKLNLLDKKLSQALKKNPEKIGGNGAKPPIIRKRIIGSIVRDIFIGKKDLVPDILEYSHLSSVLSMLLSKLMKEKKGDDINAILEALINDKAFMDDKRKINILVLLSKIESDLLTINPDFELNNPEMNKKIGKLINSKNTTITLSERIALLRLYHGETIIGETIKKGEEIDRALQDKKNQEWKYLNSKRELLEEKMKSSLSKKVS